jgi:hypothetical protein
MRLSRAALPVSGLIFVLAGGCKSDATNPLGPMQEAQANDVAAPITHEGNATVYRGRAAQIAAEERASQWAAKGDRRLLSYLESQREPVRYPSSEVDSRRVGSETPQPSFSITTADPSPQTNPNASIYASSTVVFVNGSNATVLSSITYYGNIATTEQSFDVTTLNGAVVFPMKTVTNRGEGDHQPCVGSTFQCSFTFKLVTNSDLTLGASCDRVVTAWASHRAEWTIPATRLIGAMTWGAAFAGNARAQGTNGVCPTPPPPPPTSPPVGGGDGPTQPPVQTPPPEPPPYVPPYYSPKPQHQVCIVHGEGLDWEWRQCWWVDDNDARIGTSGTLRTSVVAPSDQSSLISAGAARDDRLDKLRS